jgi:hypothetical protein
MVALLFYHIRPETYSPFFSLFRPRPPGFNLFICPACGSAICWIHQDSGSTENRRRRVAPVGLRRTDAVRIVRGRAICL